MARPSDASVAIYYDIFSQWRASLAAMRQSACEAAGRMGDASKAARRRRLLWLFLHGPGIMIDGGLEGYDPRPGEVEADRRERERRRGETLANNPDFFGGD